MIFEVEHMSYKTNPIVYKNHSKFFIKILAYLFNPKLPQIFYPNAVGQKSALSFEFFFFKFYYDFHIQ